MRLSTHPFQGGMRGQAKAGGSDGDASSVRLLIQVGCRSDPLSFLPDAAAYGPRYRAAQPVTPGSVPK